MGSWFSRTLNRNKNTLGRIAGVVLPTTSGTPENPSLFGRVSGFLRGFTQSFLSVNPSPTSPTSDSAAKLGAVGAFTSTLASVSPVVIILLIGGFLFIMKGKLK